jgi:hypothetical protein
VISPLSGRAGKKTVVLFTDLFDARPAEINKFMKGTLDTKRAEETQAMRRAGLPL